MLDPVKLMVTQLLDDIGFDAVDAGRPDGS